jgi:hypothetical protein
MNESGQSKATPAPVTEGQREIVAGALEQLGVMAQDAHWGNTIFGRLVGLAAFLLAFGAMLHIVIRACRA